MYDITDPRPSLPEWILDVHDVICTQSLDLGEREDVPSVPRKQALDILLEANELTLELEDADYALTRLLERGYLYEVNGELRVTSPSR